MTLRVTAPGPRPSLREALRREAEVRRRRDDLARLRAEAGGVPASVAAPSRIPEARRRLVVALVRRCAVEEVAERLDAWLAAERVPPEALDSLVAHLGGEVTTNGGGADGRS